MALSLSDLKQVKSTMPPRIVIYGPPGMGKTSLAAEFPNPVFIQTEDGAPSDIEIVTFGHVRSYADVVSAMGSLYSEAHDRQTLVVDSLSELEKLIWQETCARNKWKDIEQPGYGRGYAASEYVWQEFMEGLNALRRDRGMTVILIGHSETAKFDDPTSASYSRYEIDLHKIGKALVDREVDAILLIKQDVTLQKEKQGFNSERSIAGGAARFIHCSPAAAFNAKSRYGLPDSILYTKGQGYAALAPYLPTPQPQAAAPVVAAA